MVTPNKKIMAAVIAVGLFANVSATVTQSRQDICTSNNTVVASVAEHFAQQKPENKQDGEFLQELADGLQVTFTNKETNPTRLDNFKSLMTGKVGYVSKSGSFVPRMASVIKGFQNKCKTAKLDNVDALTTTVVNKIKAGYIDNITQAYSKNAANEKQHITDALIAALENNSHVVRNTALATGLAGLGYLGYTNLDAIRAVATKENATNALGKVAGFVPSKQACVDFGKAGLEYVTAKNAGIASAALVAAGLGYWKKDKLAQAGQWTTGKVKAGYNWTANKVKTHKKKAIAAAVIAAAGLGYANLDSIKGFAQAVKGLVVKAPIAPVVEPTMLEKFQENATKAAKLAGTLTGIGALGFATEAAATAVALGTVSMPTTAGVIAALAAARAAAPVAMSNLTAQAAARSGAALEAVKNIVPTVTNNASSVVNAVRAALTK
ncbi:MAG: hypothetical protein H6679_04560 [Epsilonproteobacteria bacterium]|nr:hypothetical protein [Campylobacterota bacterium]